MKGFLIPIAIVAGVLMVVQSACNSALEKSLDRPVVVGIISLSVGIGVLLSIAVAGGLLTLPEGQVARVPWWAGLGALAVRSRCCRNRSRRRNWARERISGCL